MFFPPITNERFTYIVSESELWFILWARDVQNLCQTTLIGFVIIQDKFLKRSQLSSGPRTFSQVKYCGQKYFLDSIVSRICS